MYIQFLFNLFKDKVNPPCEMTERRILTMAQQVASGLVSGLINANSLPFLFFFFDASTIIQATADF